MFQEELSRAGYGAITTEIVEAGPFYYAEDYHQQYLEANPNGYCGLGGTGVVVLRQRQRRASNHRGAQRAGCPAGLPRRTCGSRT